MIDARKTSWTDVRDHIQAGNGLAILPFGALEAHGPHLPLATDTLVVQHTARLLAEHFHALLLPAVEYGDTWSTQGFPGTVRLSTETVTAIAVDIGRSVASFGITHFVVLNGDFGNVVPLATAARRLADDRIKTFVQFYPGLDDEIARVRESRPAAPFINHGEEIETSMVLATAPETVRPERYAADYPEFPADFGLVPHLLHEFSETGMFGDPSTASAAKGNALYAAVVAAAVPEIERFLAS